MPLPWQEDGQRFWFGGEVPLEFVPDTQLFVLQHALRCHPDCAVVVELVAVLRMPGTTTEVGETRARPLETRQRLHPCWGSPPRWGVNSSAGL